MSIFTFDQPLWRMAVKTKKNNPEPNPHGIILRLGGFHTLVSYLEAVSGSGLWSLLAFTFAENTVTHILGGKVYGWAVISHLQEDDDLNTIIAAKILGIPIQVETAKGQEADHETIGIVTSRHRQSHWYSNLGW